MVQNNNDWAQQTARELDGPSYLRQSSHSATGQGSRPNQAQQAARSDDGPVVYDVPEVLRRLGVTRPTIYNFLRTGELRSFRLGSRRLVSAEALTDFIRSRESPRGRLISRPGGPLIDPRSAAASADAEPVPVVALARVVVRVWPRPVEGLGGRC